MGWGLPREGVGAEKFVPSFESLSSLGFEARNLGYPANFAGMSRIPGGVQKVCAKNVRAHFRSLKMWILSPGFWVCNAQPFLGGGGVFGFFLRALPPPKIA